MPKIAMVMSALLAAIGLNGCANQCTKAFTPVVLSCFELAQEQAAQSLSCEALSSHVVQQAKENAGANMSGEAAAIAHDICEFGCQAQREHYARKPVEKFVESNMCAE